MAVVVLPDPPFSFPRTIVYFWVNADELVTVCLQFLGGTTQRPVSPEFLPSLTTSQQIRDAIKLRQIALSQPMPFS